MGTKALLNEIIGDLIFMSLCVAMSFASRIEHKCYGGNVLCDGNVMKPKIHWELNWLNQWDQKLIKFIKDELLIAPPFYSKGNLNLVNEYNPNEPWKHQGQNGEALAVEHLYGLDKTKMKMGNNLLEAKPKFFVEAGAMDGELISNTVYLESKYNWTGLLVEPNPAYLSQLIRKRRNAWIFPYCLSPIKAPTVVEFDALAEYGGIINYVKGVKKAPGNINANYTSAYLGPSWRKTLKIQCFPLYSVLQALGLPAIDYFSLDIEGAEYPVLKTVPFQNVDIKMFGVEVEHAGKIFEGTENDITNLLKTNGYQYVAKTKMDKFFMKMDKKTIDKQPRKIVLIS